MITISEALDIALQHHQAGQLQPAEQIYRQILQVEPNHSEAIHNLGLIAHQVGRHEIAVEYMERSIGLNATEVAFHNNLGEAYRALGKISEAVACYHRALELKPEYAEAQNNLGNLRKGQGKLEEAVDCYRRAMELKPDYAVAYINLGSVLTDQGKLDEAVACYRRALELNPSYVEAYSNVLYTLQFGANQNVERIYEEHLRWSRMFAEPLAKFMHPHLNDRIPNRRLRIGYVSPDFCGHSVGRFILPLLEAHNHRDFEIFCYSSIHASDKITDLCRTHADVWRESRLFDDEQLAEVIRQDRIDILVDLTMHLANNRLLVFARKPAPVQVTYLAYCGTTGLSTMDYRLTDPYLDPPCQDGEYYSEQSIRLPETYWCYRAMPHAPNENALPALLGGPITFGCLNNFAKVTVPTLVTWCHILQAVPNSRLLLHAAAGSHRERVREIFTEHNISPERLIFAEKVPGTEYFRLYHNIDVGLDPFPYGGGTTTCDALWMGVPVVSLAGQTAVGRGGLSILSNIGLLELVAHEPQEYLQIAVELARDLPRLSQLRATLRDRMQSSPLMDAPRFARNVEAAYRRMWHDWCAK
jgi:protein O-GlcNAc transferase